MTSGFKNSPQNPCIHIYLNVYLLNENKKNMFDIRKIKKHRQDLLKSFVQRGYKKTMFTTKSAMLTILTKDHFGKALNQSRST